MFIHQALILYFSLCKIYDKQYLRTFRLNKGCGFDDNRTAPFPFIPRREKAGHGKAAPGYLVNPVTTPTATALLPVAYNCTLRSLGILTT